MFGYIAPCFALLTEEQKSCYREYYCGLCRTIKEVSGQPGRIMLSNDMTFLSMLLSDLYGSGAVKETFRCPMHPLRPRTGSVSGFNRYAANMNLLLMYYKCIDSKMDDRSLRASAGIRFLTRCHEEIRETYPRQSDEVRNALEETWAAEKSGTDDMDLLCNLSGRMLGAVFVPDPDDYWAPVLYVLGTSLGRFVYFMDAWEDLEDDIRKDRFNPLRSRKGRPDYESFCQETLEMLIAGAAEAIEALPLADHLDILRNVVYSGVWQRYNRLRQKSRKEEPDEY